MKRRTTQPAACTPARPKTLNRQQYEFCLNYLANGFNAAAAYAAAYPGVAHRTARSNGHRLLTNADILAFLNKELEERWGALRMTGEEALARVSMIARADIRQFFDHKGELLPRDQWPWQSACCVRSVRRTKDGGFALNLIDPLPALRMILELTGKLRSVPSEADALEAAIKADVMRWTSKHPESEYS